MTSTKRALPQEKRGRARRTTLPALLALSLVSCDRFGGFAYESKIDRFNGEEISTASGSESSSTTRNLKVNLQLSCERKIGSEPSPPDSVFIDIVITNNDGKGIGISDISLKFDDTTPWSYDELKTLDVSQHQNEIESNFSAAWIEKILPKQQLAILPIVALGAANSNDNSVLYGILETGSAGFTKVPKRIWVRYKTSDGIENDANFDVNDDAFRHVLKDCGWLRDGAAQRSKSTSAATSPAVPANSSSAPSRSAVLAPLSAATPDVPAAPPTTPSGASVTQEDRQQNHAAVQQTGQAPSNGGGYSAHLTGLDPNGDNYLSLRSGPGGQPYAELDRLGPETHLTVLRGQGKWLFVRLDDGRQGWVFNRYVQTDR